MFAHDVMCPIWWFVESWSCTCFGWRHTCLLVFLAQGGGWGVPEPLPVWGCFLWASHVSMILYYDSFFFQNSVICPHVFYLTLQRVSLAFILLLLACSFWCGWSFLHPWSSRIPQADFLGVDPFSLFCLGSTLNLQMQVFLQLRTFYSVILFYFSSVISLNATPTPYALMSLSVSWFAEHWGSIACPQSCPASLSSHSWSLCPFLRWLLKFISIQWLVTGCSFK